MKYAPNVISASDAHRTYIRGVPGPYINRIMRLAGRRPQSASMADCEIIRSFFEDGCKPQACADLLKNGKFEVHVQ